MVFVDEYGKQIVTVVISLVGWFGRNYFKARAKLQVAIPHQFTFLVQEPWFNPDGTLKSPTQTVNTNSYIVRNAGREAATNIEVVFNWKPMCVNIWPLRSYKDQIEADRRYIMIFDSLSPGEVMGFEVLAVNESLPPLINVRSRQCVAQHIAMYPQPVTTRFRRIVFSVMFGLGVGLTAYGVISALQFLVQNYWKP